MTHTVPGSRPLCSQTPHIFWEVSLPSRWNSTRVKTRSPLLGDPSASGLPFSGNQTGEICSYSRVSPSNLTLHPNSSVAPIRGLYETPKPKGVSDFSTFSHGILSSGHENRNPDCLNEGKTKGEKFFVFFNIYLTAAGLSCSMWDL